MSYLGAIHHSINQPIVSWRAGILETAMQMYNLAVLTMNRTEVKLHRHFGRDNSTKLLISNQPNKQVERCFLNHNSSIHFSGTDSLLMTHRGGLSLSIIIGELEEGGQVSFCPGAQAFSWRPCNQIITIYSRIYIYIFIATNETNYHSNKVLILKIKLN
jgi:hypothetical protein